MWSLPQLLRKGGLNYLVDRAVPYANARFKLSLAAHPYKPDCFNNYLHQNSSVFNRPLFMDPWTPTEIWKVAAGLHPQLSSSQVSWRQVVTPHAQLYMCLVTRLLAMHV